MIAMLVRRLLLVAAVCLVVLEALERFDPAPALPFVHADYQRCVTINPGPIDSAPPGPRTNYRTRNGGIA